MPFGDHLTAAIGFQLSRLPIASSNRNICDRISVSLFELDPSTCLLGFLGNRLSKEGQWHAVDPNRPFVLKWSRGNANLSTDVGPV